MAKVKPTFSIESFGIYSQWDAQAKDLPKIKEFTTDIPAELDIEFGYILKVKKGKGIKLNFTIFHPDIPDKTGEVMPPFTEEVYVSNNDWDFFIGDTIWEPVENKVGPWRIIIEYQNSIVAEKTFDITFDTIAIADDFALLNRKLSHKKR
ncbi:MAG: DUF3859 domain-containing protein [Thalassotalea sp.]